LVFPAISPLKNFARVSIGKVGAAPPESFIVIADSATSFVYFCVKYL
jgi:hypothetical protein